MWFKHRAWIPVAWTLALVNVAGAWFAVGSGELRHAAVHGVLAGLCALGAGTLMARRRARIEAAAAERAIAELGDQLGELEERLDFTERLLAERREREKTRREP